MDTSGRMVSGTFMGGNGVDALLAMVVDADTNVFACGNSYSSDLPVTANPFQSTNAGSGDGYVVKFGMSEQLITSISSMTEFNSLFAYPNPATDFMTVSLTNGDQIDAIEIVDASGRVVQHLNVNGDIISVRLGELQAGIYFMKVVDDHSQSHVLRFVKE
jgi:hypothetical protein